VRITHGASRCGSSAIHFTSRRVGRGTILPGFPHSTAH
jgi:hypothetical protein